MEFPASYPKGSGSTLASSQNLMFLSKMISPKADQTPVFNSGNLAFKPKVTGTPIVPPPVQQTKPVEPIRPGDATKPMSMGSVKPKPIGPIKTESVEPAKPFEPTKPVEPVKPFEPTKPVEPVKPMEPVKPVEPTKSDVQTEGEPAGPEQSEPSNNDASEDDGSEDGSNESDGNFDMSKRDSNWVTKKKLKKKSKKNTLTNIQDVNPVLKKWFVCYKDLEPSEKEWVYQQVIYFELNDPDSDKIEIENALELLTIQEIYRALGIDRHTSLPAKAGALTRNEKNLRVVIKMIQDRKSQKTENKKRSAENLTHSEPQFKKISNAFTSFPMESVNNPVKNPVNNPVNNPMVSGFVFGAGPSPIHSPNPYSGFGGFGFGASANSGPSASPIASPNPNSGFNFGSGYNPEDRVFVNTIKCLDPAKPKIIILSKVPIIDSNIIGYYMLN